MTALGSMGKVHKLDPMESPLCNTGTTRIRDLCSLQSNRTNHEDRTVCLLGHFTLRRSSALDLLLRPQRRWPSGDRGGIVLLRPSMRVWRERCSLPQNESVAAPLA